MAAVIDYRDGTVIDFRSFAFDDPRSHGFRWVDLKRFHLPAGPAADGSVLRALTVDEQFADDYAGGGMWPVKDLGEDAFHDTVVHGEFHELVIIDRTTSTLSLVVAADD